MVFPRQVEVPLVSGDHWHSIGIYLFEKVALGKTGRHVQGRELLSELIFPVTDL